MEKVIAFGKEYVFLETNMFNSVYMRSMDTYWYTPAEYAGINPKEYKLVYADKDSAGKFNGVIILERI